MRNASTEIAAAWARIEAALSRVLPASVRQLAPPAEARAVDAMEAALGVTLPPDFRASLGVHNGTTWGWPSPVPLDRLYATDQIVEATREWRGTRRRCVRNGCGTWRPWIRTRDGNRSGSSAHARVNRPCPAEPLTQAHRPAGTPTRPGD